MGETRQASQLVDTLDDAAFEIHMLAKRTAQSLSADDLNIAADEIASWGYANSAAYCYYAREALLRAVRTEVTSRR